MPYISDDMRKRLPLSAFAIPETRSFPIHTISFAKAALKALGRAKSDADRARVKAKVYRKYPQLRPSEMAASELHLSTQAREEMLIDERVDFALDLALSSKTTGAYARHKLRPLLKYYAKKPHPFRACVRDNMKRFGPGRTEAICATLKDIIRGTTHWRGHPSQDKGAAGLAASELDAPPIDEYSARIIESLDDRTVELMSAALAGEV